MSDAHVYRFELGGWVIGCLAVGVRDAQTYIKRLYPQAVYKGPWYGSPEMACGIITPAREDRIRAVLEKGA